MREALVETLGSSLPDTGGRIYHLVLPQGVELPAVTYQVISDIGELGVGGALGIKDARVQVNLWYRVASVAVPLVKKIEADFHGVKHQASSLCFESFVLNTMDGNFDPASEKKRIIIDIRLRYKEA